MIQLDVKDAGGVELTIGCAMHTRRRCAEFGSDLVARIDVDMFSAAGPSGTFREPSTAFVAEKEQFGATRRARWFGLGT